MELYLTIRKTQRFDFTAGSNTAGEFKTIHLFYSWRCNVRLNWNSIFSWSFPVSSVVFATGSIIYFKILSESFRDKDKYEILKKLGTTDVEIKKSVSNRWVCFPVAADSGDNPQHSCHFSIK